MRYLTLIFCLFICVACDQALLHDAPANEPIANLKALWQEVDQKYGLFEVKNLDWDSIYVAHRMQLDEHSTQAETYTVLRDMLALLDDSHVALVPTDPELPFFQGGIYGRLGPMEDFNFDLLKESYLPDMKFAEPFFFYGILEGNVGYIHIEGFSDLPKFAEEAWDQMLTELADTKGLVIDVRGGYGGEDVLGQYIAGRFATTTSVYMKNRIRTVTDLADFSDWIEWTVEPQEGVSYDKPIVVLTHRYTISARETFCLAMKVLPQVTFVGDTTTGAFSNQINRELPNGWGYSISIGDWRDGQGVSHEGIGLAPDIVVRNQKSDVLAGKDEALEKAMEVLQ
ncbi:MAG: S41 family peptidase [Bacteroidota bacterium]